LNYYLLKEYLVYWLHNLEEHSLHSPFVFNLYKDVIKPARNEDGFPAIEELRKRLLSDNTVIKTESFGARSTISSQRDRRIGNIANMGVSGKKYSELFFALGKYFQHVQIWELGTSLGLNTLYLASIPNARVTTFEGCSETAKVAKENFSLSNKSNVEIIDGNIDETISFQLGKIKALDMVFFDANHHFNPTMQYFEACLEKTHKSTVFIFDDIHWSKEMNNAWEKIIEHPLSRITIDIFQCGLVFFDPELPKQNFILKY
jgi:predicted O-methyltransferase YrrM